jgi:ATP-dependent Clp protease protease subunit
MGTVIFQAADKERRFMMKNSYLLLHEGESELSGKEKDIKAQKRLQTWQEERCIDIYYNKIRETRPKYPKNALTKNLDKEWYLFPEEAVEAGLADKILDHY